jgi:NAD(P)-dependent dehydrogenase (short-subunit alcohol dehydrogenase family)
MRSPNVVFNFKDSVVIVTGGASGIGKATVQQFKEAGATVVLVDQNLELGKLVAEEFGVYFVLADVSDAREVKKTALAVQKEFGQINILVNNAGIEYNDRGSILAMLEEDLRRIMDVNLMGYINMVRSYVPLMGSGGRIINVSSVQALAAHLPGTSYQATKAGILGLTRALAIELASKGITVNAIAPGAIKTEGMGAARAGSGILDPYRRRIPLGRRGHAKEVAWPILFLASDVASYITGETFVVDGGYTISITPDLPDHVTPHSLDDPDK